MKIIKSITEDGLKLTGFLSVPTTPTKRIIVHIHGMAGSPYENEWYEDFHTCYKENGIAFLAGQHRGTGVMTTFETVHGEYPTYGNAFEIFEESIHDIEAWVRFAQNLGYEEIILQSHSFGPSKVLYYLHERPLNIVRSCILISPVDMKGYAEISSHYTEMDTESKRLIWEGKPQQIISTMLDNDTLLSAQTFQNLFGTHSNANVFCYTHRKHDWKIVNAVDIPVLLIGGTNDGPIEKVCSTQKSFSLLQVELKNSPRVVSRIYEWAFHSFDGYGREIAMEASRFIKK